AELAGFMEAQLKSRGAPPEEWYAAHPQAARILIKFLNKPKRGLLDLTYHSQTPYRLGKQIAKYRATPRAVEGEAPPRPSPGGSDFLSGDLETRMQAARNRGESIVARFDFGVHLQTNPESEPLEDPRVEWKSDFIPVAEIEIPVQDVGALAEHGEGLS